MNRRVLFVDDDENLLAGIQRNLRRNFTLETALGGEEGLARLKDAAEPFAVVVSDMRMPGLDGVQFLARVRAQSPDSVRIMLTGQADMQDAINAVNEGNIFRFLNKPCDPGQLAKTLEAALEQHRLVTAERELLEKTLNGAIKLMTEVLALANGEAFSRAERIKRTVRQLGRFLSLKDMWRFELASLLSQLGCITLPAEVMGKFNQGARLSPEEDQMFKSVPSISHDLLINIPRLEDVATMIVRQDEDCGHLREQDPVAWTAVDLGAQLLRIAHEYDIQTISQKKNPTQAVQAMLGQPDAYDPRIVEGLKSPDGQSSGQVQKTVDVYNLAPGMILAENVKTSKGVLLIPAGREISATIMKFLENYVHRGEIDDKVLVLTAG